MNERQVNVGDSISCSRVALWIDWPPGPVLGRCFMLASEQIPGVNGGQVMEWVGEATFVPANTEAG